jgi:hypothetical protein
MKSIPRGLKWAFLVAWCLLTCPVLFWSAGQILMEFIWGEMPPGMKGFGCIAIAALALITGIAGFIGKWAAKP